MIVFDASTLVGAALKADNDAGLSEVLSRPKFTRSVSAERLQRFLDLLRTSSLWFEPSVHVANCRDPKDDKYFELALASGAETIVSSDNDLRVLHPWRGVRILSPADYLALT